MARASDAYARREPQMLKAPNDVRERLTAFYRERDEMDARGFESGEQKVRGTVYAVGLQRLESGDEVYESYGVISAAGVDLPQEALDLVKSLPQDWSRVCRIDRDVCVWTASLRAKGSRPR